MTDFVAIAAGLAAAASTVDGLTGHDKMPTAPRPGDVWVVMGRGERGPGDPFTVAWRVRVCVPANDEAAALTLFSEVWSDLYFALLGTGAQPDVFAPVVIPTRAGDLWAYEVVCRTGD